MDELNPYFILLLLSGMVIASYMFNLIAVFLKIPSVILLLSTGIFFQFLFGDEFSATRETNLLLELLGIIGLILIVLEGALDLKLSKEKIPVISRSLLSSGGVLIVTSSVIAAILNYFLQMSAEEAIIYSVPLGVVSSAIAIPSVAELPNAKREFIIYESTFSDILGIMLFNYLVAGNPLSAGSAGHFFMGLFLIILISSVSSLLLLFMLNYTTAHVKFFLIFSILITIYSVSKFFHLPSLLLILVFGLMINNTEIVIKGKLKKYLNPEKLKDVLKELKLITAESAFIIRTFFFILFGFTINLQSLLNYDVILIGSLIIATILIIRFILLKFISGDNIFPEMLIAPRGLITIVLFYSIPDELRSDRFNDGILFYVIIVSAVIMMLGLMLSKREFTTDIEKISH